MEKYLSAKLAERPVYKLAKYHRAMIRPVMYGPESYWHDSNITDVSDRWNESAKIYIAENSVE